jgi:hypothetical protein
LHLVCKKIRQLLLIITGMQGPEKQGNRVRMRHLRHNPGNMASITMPKKKARDIDPQPSGSPVCGCTSAPFHERESARCAIRQIRTPSSAKNTTASPATITGEVGISSLNDSKILKGSFTPRIQEDQLIPSNNSFTRRTRRRNVTAIGYSIKAISGLVRVYVFEFRRVRCAVA